MASIQYQRPLPIECITDLIHSYREFCESLGEDDGLGDEPALNYALMQSVFSKCWGPHDRTKQTWESNFIDIKWGELGVTPDEITFLIQAIFEKSLKVAHTAAKGKSGMLHFQPVRFCLRCGKGKYTMEGMKSCLFMETTVSAHAARHKDFSAEPICTLPMMNPRAMASVAVALVIRETYGGSSARLTKLWLWQCALDRPVEEEASPSQESDDQETSGSEPDSEAEGTSSGVKARELVPHSVVLPSSTDERRTAKPAVPAQAPRRSSRIVSKKPTNPVKSNKKKGSK